MNEENINEEQDEIRELTEEESDKKSLYEHHRIIVDPKQSPIRIDKFLLDRLYRVSRNKIQHAIEGGSVLVDGKNIKTNFKVKPGHVITISLDRPPSENRPVEGEDIPLDIIYEDDDVLVLNKQVGIAVHPGVGNRTGTLVNGLVYYLQTNALPVKEGNAIDRAGLVHRIDKNTSGLMVICKNDEAMTHLGKQFFNHTVERKYQALVWGEFDEPEGTIEGDIGRHPRDRVRNTVLEEGEGGKHAVTHFRTIEGLYYVSLVECQLETGRTHQIRVHMAHKGHPVFNDVKYGGGHIVKGTVFNKYKQFVMNCFKLIPRHALHAKSIGFIHPKTGEWMYFESDLPEDMQNVLTKWRGYLDSRKKNTDI